MSAINYNSPRTWRDIEEENRTTTPSPELDGLSGSWVSLAEQERAAEVEQVAKELAQCVEGISILEGWVNGSPIVAYGTELLTRARALGLLEAE